MLDLTEQDRAMAQKHIRAGLAQSRAAGSAGQDRSQCRKRDSSGAAEAWPRHPQDRGQIGVGTSMVQRIKAEMAEG